MTFGNKIRRTEEYSGTKYKSRKKSKSYKKQKSKNIELTPKLKGLKNIKKLQAKERSKSNIKDSIPPIKNIQNNGVNPHKEQEGSIINIESSLQKYKDYEEIKKEISKTKTVIESKKSTSSVDKYKLYR